MHSNSPLAIIRWVIAFITVIALHIGLAALLLINWAPNRPQEIGAAVMIELAPFAESPNNTPSENPAAVTQEASNPTPVEPEPEPEPIKEPEPEPPVEAPKPKVVIHKQKPVKKVVKKPIKKPIEKPIEKTKEVTNDTKPKAEVSSQASTTSNKVSERTAAPVTTASNKPSIAQKNWQSSLMNRLLKYKRYPNRARFKRQEGVVHVEFTINMQGNVLNKKIVKSSGHALLDQEVLNLIDRAQPLPTPPADVLKGKISINITVPISFSLKER